MQKPHHSEGWALLPWPCTYHLLLQSYTQCTENQIYSHVCHKPCLTFNDQAWKQLKHSKKCNPLLHSPWHHWSANEQQRGDRAFLGSLRNTCPATAATQNWWHKKAAKKSLCHWPSPNCCRKLPGQSPRLKTKNEPLFLHSREEEAVCHYR